MIKTVIKSLLIFSLAYAFSIEYAGNCCNLELKAETPKNPKNTRIKLDNEGEKVNIGNGYRLEYTFDKKPSMGTVILKIKIYDAGGNRYTGFKITGDYGMPSMSGAHDSGDVEFKISRKKDYLLPVNIVMPGEWEIKIRVMKDGKTLFLGSILINV